jgi:outer membrane receptor protein involved in Fe transport
VKYRLPRLYLEGFVFRNTIYDGIRIEATGDSVGPFPEFRNVNVDKLRFTGFELMGDWNLIGGFSTALSFTHLRSKDVINPNNPVGESYADKLALEARYTTPGGRLTAGYAVRYQARQKDVALGTSPIGSELPGFTVHSARVSARLLQSGPFSHTLTLALNNLTNRLYAESANVSFFRPEPGRNLSVTWPAGF